MTTAPRPFAPLIIVAAAVVLNLWLLAPEARPATPLNDGVLHLGLATRAEQTFTTDESPLDHWNSAWVLGFPVFEYYQHLPYLVVAVVHRVFAPGVELATVYNLTFYAALGAFPIAVYVGLRLLDFTPLAAALSAVFAPLLSSSGTGGFDYQSYVWRGSGMFTQAWGMSLLPLVVGLAAYTMRTGRRAGWAAAALAVCLVSHVIYAYMAVLSIGVLVLLPGRETPFARRAIRAIFVLLCAGVAVAYFLVPRVMNGVALNRSVWIPLVTYDSYGYQWVLRALATGDLLDFNRVPIVTIAAAVGFAHALVRNRTADRAAWVLLVVWLALFFGRPTWGGLYRLLPLSSELHLQRFIGGVHFFAIALAGLGAERLLSLGQGSRRRRAVVAIAVAATLIPIAGERYRYMAIDRSLIDQNTSALSRAKSELRQLFAALEDGQRTMPSRIYAGLPGTWGRDAAVGNVPMYALLSLNGFDIVGYAYHAMSFGADIQYHFDDQNPRHYDLFNVGWVVAPRRWTPAPFLTRTYETAQWFVYRAPSRGYFAIVDAPQVWKQRPQDEYQAALASLPEMEAAVARSAGVVATDRTGPAKYGATMEISAPSHLVFKMDRHPWWRATVDGRARAIDWVAPGFMSVAVAPGEHAIAFEYRPAAYKKWLLWIGLVTSVALSLVPRFLTRPL